MRRHHGLKNRQLDMRRDHSRLYILLIPPVKNPSFTGVPQHSISPPSVPRALPHTKLPAVLFDLIAASEISSKAREDDHLIRTNPTIASFKVSVPVVLDLRSCYPTEVRDLTTKVSNRPKVTVDAVVVVITTAVVAAIDTTCRLESGLVQVSPVGTGGGRSDAASLVHLKVGEVNRTGLYGRPLILVK